jgi:hypothetical protein
VNAETLPADQLACLLYDAAEGICADVAAVMLIDRHGHFLHDPAFRRIIAAGSSITTGQPLAVIRWHAAIHALDCGQLPCSGSERAILNGLKITADMAPPALRHGSLTKARRSVRLVALSGLILARVRGA